MENFELIMEQGMESLREGDYQCAFLNSKKCQYITAQNFDTSEGEEKLESIDKHFKTYKLILACYKEACCSECALRELSQYYDCFLEVYQYKEFDHRLRLKAGEFLSSVYKDMKEIYEEHDAWGEARKLSYRFLKDYKRFVIV